MSKAADLRRTADRYRRLASVSTVGGRREDRLLLTLAEELDRKAETLESNDKESHAKHESGRRRR
jgi:hypothetical protein